MKILLQHKIFIGYFLLMAIIGSMVAIVLHERNRVQKIENESIAIFQTQYDINTAHRYVTALVTYGESVLVWNNEDSLLTGNVVCRPIPCCKSYECNARISYDSLRLIRSAHC